MYFRSPKSEAQSVFIRVHLWFNFPALSEQIHLRRGGELLEFVAVLLATRQSLAQQVAAQTWVAQRAQDKMRLAAQEVRLPISSSLHRAKVEQRCRLYLKRR